MIKSGGRQPVEQETNPIRGIFAAHPGLNASAVAKRMGMSKSLFSQYVNGKKKPSKQRMEAIFETVRELGRELARI